MDPLGLSSKETSGIRLRKQEFVFSPPLGVSLSCVHKTTVLVLYGLHVWQPDYINKSNRSLEFLGVLLLYN